MRFGIFSDVHSNLPALKATLKVMESEEIDKYICLGDVVGYGGRPRECTDLVMGLTSVTVLGNHDAAVSGRMDYSYYYDAAREALDLHSKWVSEENLMWLRSLPYEHQELGLSFCHGSPMDLDQFEYVFALDQARRLLYMWEDLSRVTFIGHSHLCKKYALSRDDVHEVVTDKFKIRDGFKYIISVGSVGQPRDYDPRAAYALFDTEDMSFELKRVEYDIEQAANDIFATDLERNFGNRLFLGV